MASRTVLALCAILAGQGSGLWAQAAASPAGYVADLAKAELVSLAGVTAELTRSAPAQGGPAVQVTFDKAGDERRFVALEVRPTAPLAACRALDLTYRLTAESPLTARFALIAYERGGGAWFRSGTPLPSTPAAAAELRLSLQALRQTAFSQDASGQLEWDQIERLWVGFVVDGKGKGSFELARVGLSSEAFRATEPVAIFRADAAQWTVGADPAVSGKDTQVVDAEGAKCLKFTFHFPGGRHMYYVPTQTLGELEYSAYAGLRFTYRATVPAGVDGLMVCVNENGGQFVATPPPPATGDWEEVTVPWSAFPLGAWSKDDNGRLDIDAISQVSVGVHGTASGEGGDGEILLRAIELVPAAK
jgi:hypothetical protein